MIFNSLYELGAIVYLRTDPDQRPCMIVSVRFTLDRGLVYELAWGTTTSNHYEAEISVEKDLLVTMDINPRKEAA